MGHRAQYVLKDETGIWLFYSHWGAGTIPRDIFFGPEHALGFIRSQESVDGWLDDVWCEGAVFLDTEQKRLSWYGGHLGTQQRRAVLALMREVWTGYEVTHCDDSLSGIARLAGVELEVEPEEEGEARSIEIRPYCPAEGDEWINGLVSVRGTDGALRVYATATYGFDLVRAGAAMLDALGRQPSLDVVENARKDGCGGGLHVDLVQRTIDYWIDGAHGDHRATMAEGWPGWTLRHHGDDFAKHTAWSEDRIRFAPEPLDLAQVREWLCQDSPPMADTMRKIAAQMAAEQGGGVMEINPSALTEAPLALDVASRIAIIDAAIARFRSKH